MPSKYFFFLLSLACLPLSTAAQTMVFQDPQQFIWQVEGSSVHRFDGYSWRTFSPSDGLPNVPIRATFFDAQKRLWLFGEHASSLIYLDSLHNIHSIINNIGIRDFSISTAWESGDSLFFKDGKTAVCLFLEKNKTNLQRFYGQKRTPEGKSGQAPQYKTSPMPLMDCFFDERTKTVRPNPFLFQQISNQPLKMACRFEGNTFLGISDNALFVFEKNKKARLISFKINGLPEFKQNKLSFTCISVIGDAVFIGCTEGSFFVAKNEFLNKTIQLNPADFNITNTTIQTLDAADNYVRMGKTHQILPCSLEKGSNTEGSLFATENGLFLFKIKEKTLQRLSEKYDNIGAAVSTKIFAHNDFLVLKNGKRLKTNGRITHLSLLQGTQKLVGATEQGGLFEVKNDEIHYFTALNDPIFTQIESDVATKQNITEERLWALSKTQIVDIFIENKELTINRFDIPEGTNHFLIDGDTLHFFGEKGWFYGLKKALKVPMTPPNVLLESIKIGGVERAILKEYDNLETEQRTVIVKYVGISPPSLGDIVYKYRLFDIQKPWFGKIDTGNWQYTRSRELVLPLDAGWYQLDISAVNKYGVATEIPLSTRFVVAPPIWERWWFWLIATAIIALAIFGTFKGREQQLKQRNEKLELKNEALELRKNFVELELQALQAQMNTHFVANALTAIQGFVMRNDKVKANKYIVDFYTLVRLFLDSSRQNIHPLEKELTLLDRYIRLQQLFYTFDYHIHIGDDIYPTELDVPTALYQPFVENAIVHGLRHRDTEGSLLTIHFERTKHTFTCCIEDNGVGREKSWAINQTSDAYRKFSTSVSTKIIEKRRATLNQTVADKVTIRYEDLKNTDGLATGTRVFITTKLEEETA